MKIHYVLSPLPFQEESDGVPLLVFFSSEREARKEFNAAKRDMQENPGDYRGQVLRAVRGCFNVNPTRKTLLTLLNNATMGMLTVIAGRPDAPIQANLEPHQPKMTILQDWREDD